MKILYKITLELDTEDIQELENILDKYDIDYEINEVYKED